MQDLMDKLLQALLTGLPNVVIALAILLISLYSARLVSKLLARLLQNRHAPADIAHLLAQATFWAIAIIGLITALQRFFDVTAFLAGLGILGFAVGFGLQDITKNFAAGIVLLLQHPFRVGEVISVAGFDGTVLGIDLRTTELKTVDGRIVTLPNADILTHPIINYTRAYYRRVDFSLKLPQDLEPEAARRLILGVIRSVKGFIAEPAPRVIFHTMSGSALELTTYFWIDTSINNPPEAKDAALVQTQSALSAAGIEIPREVQMVYFEREGMT